jgi:Bacterial pre-peptidase C-terminal domain.
MFNQAGTTNESILKNLTPGTYYVRVNSPSGADTNYNLQLSATAIPDGAGNEITTAQDIGALGATAVTKNDWVGGIDNYDYYKFSLTKNSTLNLNLSGLTQNANLHLMDSDGDQIAYSIQAGTKDESILNNLTPGTYYVRVNSPSGEDTTYNLGVSATALTYSPANIVGNTLSQNLNIGALGTTQTFSDFVGNPHGIKQDETDYYTFSIPSASSVNLKLTGLTANADLYLYDSNGSAIANSSDFSNVDETISKSLNAGTYRIGVLSKNSANTGYNLQASADR